MYYCVLSLWLHQKNLIFRSIYIRIYLKKTNIQCKSLCSLYVNIFRYKFSNSNHTCNPNIFISSLELIQLLALKNITQSLYRTRTHQWISIGFTCSPQAKGFECNRTIYTQSSTFCGLFRKVVKSDLEPEGYDFITHRGNGDGFAHANGIRVRRWAETKKWSAVTLFYPSIQLL